MRINTILIKTLKLTAFFVAFVGITGAGYFYGKERFTFEVRRNVPQVDILNKNPRDLNITYDFSLYWEVWDKLSKEYLERPIDGQKMVSGSIDALKQYAEAKEASQTAQLNENALDENITNGNGGSQ